MTSAQTVTATFQPTTWTLSVRIYGTGAGTVTGPDGFLCRSGLADACTAAIPNTSPATVVSLVAAEDPGSSFLSWSGCTSVSGRTCNVTMSAARSVFATFTSP
ncbi:MAG TPA: hypothetical protein VLS93_16010 [Anaeromyxobacteraceae bacterium]|nr:hypothetical protein [Anaeromyxobacteraceae bacterium]